MVEAILAMHHGLRRQGKSCASFKILPEMMQRFNQNMYDHKRPRPVEPAQKAAQPEQGAGPNAEGDNGDAKMAEILNDVEELFGEPVFLTH